MLAILYIISSAKTKDQLTNEIPEQIELRIYFYWICMKYEQTNLFKTNLGTKIMHIYY